MRPSVFLHAALALAALTAPAAARAQSDLPRLRGAEPRRAPDQRPPAHRPPPVRPRRVQPVLLVVPPFGVTATTTPTEPLPTRVPATRVIEVPAAADTTCRDARTTRDLAACLGAAVHREDAALAAAERRARESLAQSRPAATVAAHDRAAGAWRRYRDAECRARTLAVGGGSAAAYEGLACQLRLARERRAALDSPPDHAADGR